MTVREIKSDELNELLENTIKKNEKIISYRYNEKREK